MTCVRRNLNNRNCCNSWQKGIRTINNQYPDDNREFEIAAGNGISVVPITAGILITNTSAASSFVEGRNIDIIPSGTDLQISVEDQPDFDGLTVNGTSTFNGDIIQNGAAYETHAEKIYTTNDYVIMRDGAVGGLAAGDYSGFQVKLYDGVNDGRLVIDNAGTARVGDVGDEEPLLTRDEAADLTDGAVLKWDAANYKAINEGTIGSDTKPLKSVSGVLTPVTDDVALADWTEITNDLSKMQTAHEIVFSAVENNTFLHSMLIPGSRTSAYVGLSAGGNYLNVLIQSSGITTISSAGTWTLLKVFVR